MKATSNLIISILLLIISLFLYFYNYDKYPNMFDDAYIGYRISENVSKGHGLVFNAGDNLWVNTSFLYPLYNGFLFFISEENAINLAVISDIFFHVVTLFLLYQILSHFLQIELVWYRFLFAIASVCLIHARVSSGVTCGMESNMYTLFIVSSIYSYYFNRSTLAYVMASLCFWVRPEGCLVPLALYTADLVRHKILFQWDKVIIVTVITVIYFIIVYTYYGSFIPHSIIAKSLVEYNKNILFEVKSFLTISSFHFTGFFYLTGVYVCCKNDKLRPLAIFSVFYVLFFSIVATWIYGWYHMAALVPYYFIVAIGLYQAVIWLLKITSKSTSFKVQVFSKIMSVAFLLLITLKFFITHINNQQLGSSGFQKRIQQSKEIADIVINNTNTTDYITLEPLGIISFYTKNRLFADYPGLCSKQVTELNKKMNRKVKFSPTDTLAFQNVVKNVKPNVLVLRENEYKVNADFLNNEYNLLKEVCIENLSEEEVFVTGISKCFKILKRR